MLFDFAGQDGNDYRLRLTRAVSHSRVALLIRLTGVDDLCNDPSVHVNFYVGYPTFQTGCDSVLPGREYSVASTSVTPGATSIDQATASVDGAIVNGRLRVDPNSTAHLLVPLDIFTAPVDFDLQRLQIRANVDPSALVDGTLAGALRAEDVINAWNPAGIVLAETVVEGLIDLPTPEFGMNVCYDTTASPPVFGQISMGFAFHAVPAVVSTSTPIAASPEAGVCGADAGVADGGVDP